jgi:spore coat polysaccharide biosynthesis protein SpsF
VSEHSAIVLQARMGSTRLPGKVMAMLSGASVLAHCIARLRFSSAMPVIVATTTNAADDVVEEEAMRLGARVLRGPADDVLARYALAVTTFDLAQVVRATADNPAVDMDAPRRSLALLQRTGADYVVEHGLPHGAAVEAVSASAILLAADQASNADDREHVTPFIKRDHRCVAIDAIAPGGLRRSDLRFTVDTPEDLEFLRKVFGWLPLNPAGPASLAVLIEAADRVRRSGADAPGSAAQGTR